MELKKLQNQILIFEKANNSLQKIFEQNEFNELEKDGVIQRFEYTVEISWKTLKKVLDYQQLNFTPSPREIIRESYKLNYIESLELWDEFLDVRNQMSHIYSDYYSKDNFDFIILNAKNITKLVSILKEKFI